MVELPRKVLFACNRNTIRSPMAEAIMKHLLGHRVEVDSVGVLLNGEEVSGFAIAALREIGLDIAGHVPKTFEDVDDSDIDMIVTFSPQAQHRAVDFARNLDCEIEYWPTMDPTIIEGNRDTQLAAYREIRDRIFERITVRFPLIDRPALG